MKETILGQLNTSKDAPYASAGGDDVQRQGCTPGTRVDIRNKILGWARSPDPVPSLLWLYGLAGIGKTAIAMSLCETLEEDGLLASSYFCSIQLDSGNSKFIVPTIAQHLAAISRAYAVNLVSQLQNNPDLAHYTLKRQLDGLLCNPWKSAISVRATLPPLVVVIDALDECDHGVEFLTHLVHAVVRGDLQGIRFFVTSRPVPRLAGELQSKLDEGQKVALHDVDRDLVDQDIRLYLQSQFGGRGRAPIDLDVIIFASGGLFIFAATVVKYILPFDRELTPVEQGRRLESILSKAPGTTQGIDDLYSRIVSVALPREERPSRDQEQEFKERLRILHTVITVVEPQPAEVIAELAGLDIGIVLSVVQALHSVLHTAADGRIHIFHASFYDYIVVQERCFSYHCDILLINHSLATKCLHMTNDRLKFNICCIESSFTPDNELDPPLHQRISNYIGHLLTYSCRHWWDHWKMSNEESHDQLSSLLHDVLQKKGLFWVESMSLLGHLQACKLVLEGCSSLPESGSDIVPLAKVAAQMVSMFISMPPPRITSQLYLSLLAIWTETAIPWKWKAKFLQVPQVLQRQLDGRQHCRMRLNLGSPVLCVAFSRDGKRVVSGSEDTTIRLWDVDGAKETHLLEGHTDDVRSVAFSPDGKRVVSGSYDTTIRLWDVDGAKELHCLKGHTSSVLSVAFSPDGKRVVSGSRDWTIRFWDIDEAQETHCFEGHTDEVRSVAFSPDGKRVVSGSYDTTICLWDVDGTKEIHRFERDISLIQSAAFSMDGKRIVSGSLDDTIHLWDVDEAQETHCLKGHTSSVLSAAFSTDGKRIVSGSDDHTIRFWDIDEAKEIHRFEGHTASVQSVAFSPDGKRVVSGSHDWTVRLWDVDEAKEPLHLEGHTSTVRSVVFSPDGKWIASGSNDQTIRLWEVEEAKELHCFKGHTSWVRSVAFSSDGKRIVSGSTDQTIRLWDVEEAKELHCFEGHTSWVVSVAFSPDGKRVVSGSDDHTIRLWDVDEAQETHCFEGHTASVQSVAFSPDGKRVVSGSNDRTLRIWDIDEVKETYFFEGRTSWVQSVTVLPDSEPVISSPQDLALPISGPALGKNLLYHPFSTVAFLDEQSTSPPLPGILYLNPTGLSFHMLDDGWVVSSKERTGKEEKLLWLPPSLRPFHPPVLQVFARGGFNRIDLTGCVFGIGWDRCYVGGDDGR